MALSETSYEESGNLPNSRDDKTELSAKFPIILYCMGSTNLGRDIVPLLKHFLWHTIHRGRICKQRLASSRRESCLGSDAQVAHEFHCNWSLSRRCNFYTERAVPLMVRTRILAFIIKHSREDRYPSTMLHQSNRVCFHCQKTKKYQLYITWNS